MRVQPDHQARAEESGCAALFTKPFSAQALRAALDDALRASPSAET